MIDLLKIRLIDDGLLLSDDDECVQRQRCEEVHSESLEIDDLYLVVVLLLKTERLRVRLYDLVGFRGFRHLLDSLEIRGESHALVGVPLAHLLVYFLVRARLRGSRCSCRSER